VSHDLRAPLINIQGFSKRLEPLMQETLHALEEAGTTPAMPERLAMLKERIHPQVTESLKFISKGVERMDRLLASLLTVSRAGRTMDSPHPHDLNEIVADVLMTFDHQLTQRGIRVARRPLPQRVLCRREDLTQIFSNLISNAINYMGSRPAPLIEIGGTAAGEQVECFVRDTGVGIDAKDHERIFQMFTRLQAVEAAGEGVGLAYVKKILRCYGGRIWVVSQPGQGSTFTFTLPAAGRAVPRVNGR
jgi:signal transduction histidine kinase